MRKFTSIVLAVLMLAAMWTMPVLVNAAEGEVIFTPTQSNCDTFTGWTGGSSLKRFDGKTVANTGGGSAIFTVPDTVSGWTDIYYYIPYYSEGYTKSISCNAKLILTDSNGRVRDLNVGVYSGNGGNWVKAGTAIFSGEFREIINVTSADNGYSRLTDVKFVSNGKPSYIVSADNFGTTGGWTNTYNSDAYGTKLMFGGSTSNPKNAILKADNVAPGEYYMYIHSADYNYNTGVRQFTVIANNVEYKRSESGNAQYFGTHLIGTEYENAVTVSNDAAMMFGWEQASYPKNTVTVGEDGILNIELHAKSGYARMDAILLTQADDFDITTSVDKVADSVEQLPAILPYDKDIDYPASYTGTLTSESLEAKLENKNTTVSFKLGTLSNGNTMVQREIKVGDTVTVPFDSGLGFLCLRSDEVVGYQSGGYYGNFNVRYMNEEGNDILVNTDNVFRSGVPEWIIPDTLEQVNDNTVKMTADGKNVSLVAVWTLGENDKEPKVTVSFTAKKDGEYSFGLFNDVTEFNRNDITYVLNPYRWQENRIPTPGQTITETNSTTDHTQVTKRINSLGQEITLGVAVDQSSIDLTVPADDGVHEYARWPHDIQGHYNKDKGWDEDNGQPIDVDFKDYNIDFVMNTTGNNGGILPAVFAPKMASVDSSFKAGQTYTFSYRPLSTVSTSGENRGWYDCYEHVAKDLRGIYDYRDNYFSSMTDAAFNILRFLKNDELSGWDDNMIGHYNIEDSHWVTNSNQLVYLQSYMLTEDKDLLMERALPVLATLLTRGSSHIHSRFSIRSMSEGPIVKDLDVATVEAGNTGYEGAYLMTRGQNPIFRTIAKNRLMLTNVESAGTSARSITDVYWYEHANSANEYTETIKYADKYLNDRSFISATNHIDEESFINISYTPHFQSQFDAYEITGDTKYLEGAVEAARRFLPSLRITDIPASKDDEVLLDQDFLVGFDKVHRSSAWSTDYFRYRRGAKMLDLNTTNFANGAFYRDYQVKGYADGTMTVRDFTDTVPEWVISRSGLGVEQFSTCLEGRNIMMSTWAGDVLRLGYLSGDQLMMDLARSSLVGRFANYPGYYMDSYRYISGFENYPIDAFDSTSLYFHHAPVFLSAVQDYLFSNAYVKSDGNVDFPNVRDLGYAWFNNRIYGHEPGFIYGEKEMWPWLCEGTITVSSKQIDWIGGRKEGRGAFVLTNAGDNDENVNSDLGIENGSIATLYDKQGNKTMIAVNNNKVQLQIPAKGIMTVAVSGSNIHAPEYSRVKFDETATETLGNSAFGVMYEGNTYSAGTVNGRYVYSPDTGYDVKAYALAIDPESYMGYIFVGGRSTELYNYINEDGNAAVGGGDGEKGIVKTTLKWHYDGENNVTTVTDDKFPYEFFIPVYDRSKKIVFTVETEFKNETKTLGREYTLEPVDIELEDTKNKTNFSAVSMGDITTAIGSVTSPLTTGNVKFCIKNDTTTTDKFEGVDILQNNALKDCYLNGYLRVNDWSGSADIKESGYILFDNVKISESANNASKSRVDFSIGTPFTLTAENDLTKWAEYDEQGNYLGVKQNMLYGSGVREPYVWDNLYITNSANDNKVYVTKEVDNTYTISCNGAKYCFIIIATYNDAGRMTDVEATQEIISINNSKNVALSKNQKLFVWNNEMYKGSSMIPIVKQIEK